MRFRKRLQEMHDGSYGGLSVVFAGRVYLKDRTAGGYTSCVELDTTRLYSSAIPPNGTPHTD